MARSDTGAHSHARWAGSSSTWTMSHWFLDRSRAQHTKGYAVARMFSTKPGGVHLTPGLLISKSSVGGFAPIRSVKSRTDDGEERSSFSTAVLEGSPIGLAVARSSRPRGTPGSRSRRAGRGRARRVADAGVGAYGNGHPRGDRGTSALAHLVFTATGAGDDKTSR